MQGTKSQLVLVLQLFGLGIGASFLDQSQSAVDNKQRSPGLLSTLSEKLLYLVLNEPYNWFGSGVLAISFENRAIISEHAPIESSWHALFRALNNLLILNSHWVVVTFPSPLIGCCDYYAFGFNDTQSKDILVRGLTDYVRISDTNLLVQSAFKKSCRNSLR